jgi:hypothetical protein
MVKVMVRAKTGSRLAQQLKQKMLKRKAQLHGANSSRRVPIGRRVKRKPKERIVAIPKEQIINRKIKNFHTLAICSIFNHEDPYLREWLSFHLKQGVDHFFMYDNGCSKSSEALLKPYIDQRIVTYRHWPDRNGQGHSIQREAYRHCLQHYGSTCLWLAFIDIDEFLYSRGNEHHLKRLLSYYNHSLISQIEVPRYNFGNCRHTDKPSGKVVINYLLREHEPSTVKSIVNPSNLNPNVLTHSVHRFGNLVKKGQTLSGPRDVLPFKINHYLTKSTQEFEQRNAWWKERNQHVNFNPVGTRLNTSHTPEKWNQVYDDDILRCL